MNVYTVIYNISPLCKSKESQNSYESYLEKYIINEQRLSKHFLFTVTKLNLLTQFFLNLTQKLKINSNWKVTVNTTLHLKYSIQELLIHNTSVSRCTPPPPIFT